jgi:hypothetical protein
LFFVGNLDGRVSFRAFTEVMTAREAGADGWRGLAVVADALPEKRQS